MAQPCLKAFTLIWIVAVIGFKAIQTIKNIRVLWHLHLKCWSKSTRSGWFFDPVGKVHWIHTIQEALWQPFWSRFWRRAMLCFKEAFKWSFNNSMCHFKDLHILLDSSTRLCSDYIWWTVVNSMKHHTHFRYYSWKTLIVMARSLLLEALDKEVLKSSTWALLGGKWNGEVATLQIEII